MSDFDRLRALLLAEEREALARAERRLDTLDDAQGNLPRNLPGLLRRAPAKPMADALASPVASALGSAVRTQSKSIVEALFPVIGPLIRKSIAEALRGLMGDINGALEQSLTVRGLRWRLEAWRSGVPYAQVVLKHTLRYRIDHLFVIERDSGLVLRRESAPGLPDLDADAIAGMLTAIGHFVRDSVGRSASDSLEEARVGEYLLWVIDGPRASIACFIEGVPPDGLRTVLEQRLESIHAGLGDAGELAPQDVAGVDLDLAELARGGMPEGSTRHASPRWPALLLFTAALVALAWYGLREWRWQERVEVLRTSLASHPGFVLTGLDARARDAVVVRGLLDADADPLATRVREAGFTDVEPVFELSGYVSTADDIVARRARRLLEVPDGVGVEVASGRLRLAGPAPAAWAERARERAGWVPGVREVAFEVVIAEAPPAAGRAPPAADLAALTALAQRLQEQPMRFARDLEPEPGSEGAVAALAAGIAEATALAGQAGVGLQVEVVGCNDAPGSDEINTSLRGLRARWLHDALVAHGVPAGMLRLADPRVEPAGATMMFRGASLRLKIEPAAR